MGLHFLGPEDLFRGLRLNPQELIALTTSAAATAGGGRSLYREKNKEHEQPVTASSELVCKALNNAFAVA